MQVDGGIKDRIKELRRVPARELVPNPRNWRRHPEAQRKALKGILAEIGYADALLVREVGDGKLMLIDGHLRAETTPDSQVPVLVLDVNEEEADKLLATVDPLAAMAQRDNEAIGSLLKDLQGRGDQLHTLVFPDYLVQPLVGAEWKPPTVNLTDEGGDILVKAISVTAAQRRVIEEAIAKARNDNPEAGPTEGAVVAAICKFFLGEISASVEA